MIHRFILQSVTLFTTCLLAFAQSGYIGNYHGYPSPVLSYGYAAPNYVAAPVYTPAYSHGYIKPEPVDYYVSTLLAVSKK